MTSASESLEAAAQALRDAQETVRAARRVLTGAIFDAYADGEPVSRIAERADCTSTDVWNTLAVRGITRGGHHSGIGAYEPAVPED